MKKSTIPALCFFAVIVAVAHWPRPFTFAVRVQTAGVPPLDLATTDFVRELNRLGLQRAPNEENFAAGLVEFIDIPDLTGPARKATLAAYEIEDTKKAQSFLLSDFITAKYRFPGRNAPFGHRYPQVFFPRPSGDVLGSGPWTRRQFPDVSEWLDAKNGLLEDIERISHRPHYFQFVFSEDGTVEAAQLPLVSAVRQLTYVYSAQVNRALGEGKLAEAQKGIFTLLRIAALLIDGGQDNEILVGCFINEQACRLALQWLSHLEITSLSLDDFVARLDETPPLTMPVRVCDVHNRLGLFEQLQRSHRHGVRPRDWIPAHRLKKQGLGPRLVLNALLCSLADWNDFAQRSAQEADELVETLRLEDTKTRRTRVREFKESRQRIGSLRDPAWQLARGQFGALSRHFFWLTATTFERASMNRKVVKLCVALKRHQLEHGEFPDKPGEALEEQSGTLPADVYSDQPMRYLKTGNGVVLYSVGRSQTDNGGWSGQGRDDEVWVLGTDDRQDPLEQISEQDALLARLKHMGVHLFAPEPDREPKRPPIYFDGTVTDEQVARFIEMKQEWAPLSDRGWTLWFLGSQITDASLDRLSQLNGISALLFFDTDITDAGLSRIKDFKGLTMLYLGQPKVTDTGLAHLKEATQLRVLNTRGTMGTDAG